MHYSTLKKLILILMRSPVFRMLSPHEKRTLLLNVKESHTEILEDEGIEIGYEASWEEALKSKSVK